MCKTDMVSKISMRLASEKCELRKVTNVGKLVYIFSEVNRLQIAAPPSGDDARAGTNMAVVVLKGRGGEVCGEKEGKFHLSFQQGDVVSLTCTSKRLRSARARVYQYLTF